MHNTFVTGATGLLGNNLVRELVARGHAVKALIRSRAKGEQQFKDLPGVELVVGDMADVDAFAASLQGCDTVFHTGRSSTRLMCPVHGTCLARPTALA